MQIKFRSLILTLVEKHCQGDGAVERFYHNKRSICGWRQGGQEKRQKTVGRGDTRGRPPGTGKVGALTGVRKPVVEGLKPLSVPSDSRMVLGA